MFTRLTSKLDLVYLLTTSKLGATYLMLKLIVYTYLAIRVKTKMAVRTKTKRN